MGTQTFITEGNNSWTCPAGVGYITVECWGGGQAGCNGGTTYSAGGGRGGDYAKVNTMPVHPGIVYTATVAAYVSAGGGAGGVGGNYSQFIGINTTCKALGGSGNGGSIGDVTHLGGVSGEGYIGVIATGGGGGEGAESSANGHNGASGVSGGAGGTGGTGGDGGNGGSNGGDGQGGNAFGGGGGGGSTKSYVGHSGGYGMSGKVTLTWTDPVNIVRSIITKKAS
jgi:hypothetical protein